MDDFQKELLAVFREEVAESLDAVAVSLGSLRTDSPEAAQEAIQSAFRAAHNAKGAARTVGLDLFERLAHVVEDVLGGYRGADEVPPEPLVARILRAVALLERLAAGEEDEEAVDLLIREILEDGASPGTSQPAAARGGTAETSQPAAAHGASPETSQPAAARGGTASGDSDARTDRESIAVAETPAETGPSAASPESSATVRVDLERLDDVMSHVAELMVAQVRRGERSTRLSRLEQGLRGMRRILTPEARKALDPLVVELERLCADDRNDLRQSGYLTGELGGSMKRLRMLPLASLATQWRSIVRESALVAGRDAELVLRVGDVQLDKHILDALRDPLMHLLRNAVAHGLEAPEERDRAGKPRRGRVCLSARVRGSMVEIEVSDDGRGLDATTIGVRALEIGLCDGQELAELDPGAVLDLVFTPGFSTAGEVSRLSGRGVGLDAVRERVRGVGGTVTPFPTSELGGAAFRLTAPLSLVSTHHLLVRSGGMIYALPSERVARSVRVSCRTVQQVEGASAVSLDGAEPLRLRWLASVMGRSRPADDEILRVIVVERAGRSVGLVVDAVIGVEEHVTKPLPWNLRHVPGAAGTLILGDGSLAVVTDVDHLFEGSSRESLAGRDILQRRQVSQRKRILVVDDSLTSRTLERNILVSAGFEVEVATDGTEGWEVLQRLPVDLVVSDVEMPGLDGFELTRRIRQKTELRELPVVLVTSLDRPEDRAAGAEAGADEYIVKGHFDQRRLLEAIDRLT